MGYKLRDHKIYFCIPVTNVPNQVLSIKATFEFAFSRCDFTEVILWFYLLNKIIKNMIICHIVIQNLFPIHIPHLATTKNVE